MRALAVGLVVGCVSFGLGCGGLIAPPSPYAGDVGFVYMARGADAAADGPRIAARLQAAGVDANVDVTAPDQLTITVSDVVHSFPSQRFLAPGRLAIVFPEGSLTNEDLADAEATDDAVGQPIVQLQLTEQGAQRFCKLSGAHIGEPIPIRLDGETLMEPVVREAICGGKLQLTLGAGSSEARVETEALATTLQVGEPLAGPWTLTDVRVLE